MLGSIAFCTESPPSSADRVPCAHQTVQQHSTKVETVFSSLIGVIDDRPFCLQPESNSSTRLSGLPPSWQWCAAPPPRSLTPPTSTGNHAWQVHRWRIIRLLSPVALVVAWQLLSATGLLSADVLPAPQLIFEAGWQLIQNGKLAEALEVSGLRVVEGLLLGGLAGVALGVAVGLSPWVEATVDPPLQALRALPHLGLIPLFILWFGIGELAKVNLVALGVAFPLYLNTFSAIRQADHKLLETADVLGFCCGNGCASFCCRARPHRCWSGCANRWPSRG